MSGSGVGPRTMAVQYGRRRIEYTLRYSARTTLAIDVNPDLSVAVTAPAGSTDEAVGARVHKRAAWIVEQQRFFATYLPALPARRYVSGESHWYLGRQYRLRVEGAEADGVRLSRGRLNVGLADREDVGRVEALVTGWLRGRAEAVFGEVFAAWATAAARHGIEGATYQLRRMKNRWGSCTRQGRILLNPDLIVAPVACIAYVVAHELCHVKEHNHGARFYRLLGALMPDWAGRRERLNRCVTR